MGPTLEHANVLARAGRALTDAAAPLLERSVHDPLPLFRPQRAVAALDADLSASIANAREAADLLESIPTSSEAAADGAIRRLQRGARTFANQLEQRAAIDKPRARWRADVPSRWELERVNDLGVGLQHAARGEYAAWAISGGSSQLLDRADRVASRGTLLALQPGVEPAVAALVPPASVRSQPWAHQVMAELAQNPSNPREAALQSTWRLTQSSWMLDTPRVPRGYVRRLVDEAAPATTTWRPDWIRLGADDELVAINPARGADLRLLGSSHSATAIEELVAHGLSNEVRGKFVYGFDEGAELARAARRLPDDLRPSMPDGIEADRIASKRWARQARADRIGTAIEGRPVDATLIRELVAGEVDRSVPGSLRMARELLDRLPTSNDAAATMRIQLGDDIDSYLARYGRGWHPEYAEVGRLRQGAALLEKLDQLPAAAEPAAASADAAAAAAPTGAGDLVW